VTFGAQIVQARADSDLPPVEEHTSYQEIGLIRPPHFVAPDCSGEILAQSQSSQIASEIPASVEVPAPENDGPPRKSCRPAQPSEPLTLSADSRILLDILESTYVGRQILRKRKNILSLGERKALSDIIARNIFDVDKPFGQQ
jgi:hypothetical protein